MAGARLDRPRIGLDQTEGLDRQPEEPSCDLRVACLMPLPVGLGAEDQ